MHYAFGAALSGVYGAAATRWNGVTTGFGALFGLAVALVADEGLVPALGLGPAPTRTDAKTHAFGLASHLVFGLALEGSRRVLNRVF